MAQKRKNDAATATLSPEEEAEVRTDPQARDAKAQEVLAGQLRQQADARGELADVLPSDERQATRAAHSFEGGGAWPDEVLRDRFVNPSRAENSPELNYTSHESQGS